MSNPTALSRVQKIAGKEISLFFASPIAYLFLAVFLGVTLFIFFWVEAFFARNIADIRPMFEWMPILLIFLCCTLTMRLWSEERRTGTLEFLMTRPVPLWQLVLGKFASCLLLLLLALALTLPLPITVALLGNLDWGPVISGYLAVFLLGAAYLAIGLFVSARSDNQIVSLISAIALCSLFYLLGSSTLTDLVASPLSDWLKLLGTGSRFESIARGVIDIRDLFYYLTLVLVFLSLNILSLERSRWASTGNTGHHKHWRVISALVIVNAIAGNLWLGQINSARIDTTEARIYSLSDATRNYLAQLQEPLLLRAYFSSKTHPLLAPLVPQLKDLLHEYEVAGKGRVKVEIIDPQTDPEAEKEANEQYGVKPVPLQIADRYQASIVSAYFDVVISYGDQHQTLGFRDFIDVRAKAEGDIEVALRNPEHDITRAIKKSLQAYQTSGNLFDAITDKIELVGYVSSDQTLPKQLSEFNHQLTTTLQSWQDKSNGKFSVRFVDPQSDAELAKKIQADYGFGPMAADLFGSQTFYYYLTLQGGNQVFNLPISELSSERFEQDLKAGLQRFTQGFSKTIGLVAPAPSPYGQYGGAGRQFSRLNQYLGENLKVKNESLSSGKVSGDVDLLLLAAPENLNEKQLFAIDQFLMQGGTVIMATSPFGANLSTRNLSVHKHTSGLDEWLAQQGIKIEPQLVLDPQNAALPVPVNRNIGGFQVQELRMMDYPYFVDIRQAGLAQQNPITAHLPQVTMAWSSPISIDKDKLGDRSVTDLLFSSQDSWLSDSTNVLPGAHNDFVMGQQRGPQRLGLVVSGRFESYFKGKPSPLVEPAKAEQQDQKTEEDKPLNFGSVIEHSPDSARLIVFSSNDFLSDSVLAMAGAASGNQYTNPLALISNAIDWSLDDDGLAAIRARGHFNRTLPPMTQTGQMVWEYGNYTLAVVLLLLLALIRKQQNRRAQATLVRAFSDTPAVGGYAHA